MEEIARVLFENYIVLFGPPKMIVSDPSTEFVNNVVASILKMHGVEHVVISAYNPVRMVSWKVLIKRYVIVCVNVQTIILLNGI